MADCEHPSVQPSCVPSWQEVAEARAGWLGELMRQVEPFAQGRDISEVFARKLGEWVADKHGDDPRFATAIAALAGYRGKVGREEAATACQRLLATVRRDTEGPRAQWRSPEPRHRCAWGEIFGVPGQGSRVDAACPACGAIALRRYFRDYGSGRGGGWEWCAACFRYEHLQIRVPHWWSGDPQLDRIPVILLDHTPEFLQRAFVEPTRS
jgi:hypothetical protein